jgi:DNA mismatch repair protein MutS2
MTGMLSRFKKDELDLHRLTVDEAIPRLDKFLHDAFRSGYYRVWIIHGKGSGILRQEVGRFLAKHSLVKSYRTADPQHGGAGATQVELSDR